MFSITLSLIPLLLLAARGTAGSQNTTAGFTDPVNTSSAAGYAACVEGTIRVTVTSERTNLLIPEPINQASLTELVAETLQVSPRLGLVGDVDGGSMNVTDTFRIFSKLCRPRGSPTFEDTQTVQVLSHADLQSSQYWDIAPGYSYIDAAVQAGYATFSYDRIGVGKSDHPDPIQVVQGSLSQEILHAIVVLLRRGYLGGKAFPNVVGVGHAAGASVTQAVTTKYPSDFDAVILTGTSNVTAYQGICLAAFSFEIANLDPSGRFKGLPNGYVVQNSAIGIQLCYYRYPNFDTNIFNLEVARKETQTLGELATLGKIISPSPQYTGPVDVLLGENDFVFCGGNCSYPTDQSAATLQFFYPAASKRSQTYLVPGSGHDIDAHYSAPSAFAQMIAFLKANDIV